MVRSTGRMRFVAFNLVVWAVIALALATGA
jgi:hypothetical protein